jgi:hypothetical protein
LIGQERPMTKSFRLSPEQIEPLAPGLGSCIASDRITVDGLPVGFMYREEPEGDTDSGWRFMAGDEDEAYMEDPDRFGLYDLNTLANYDPDIVPLLDAPLDSAYERSPETGRLVAVTDWQPSDES